MSRFSKETDKMLRKYGWYEGREFDDAKQIEILKKEGFPVFDIAKRVLKEFGGLKFPVKDHRDDPAIYCFHFNAGFAAESLYLEALNIYSKIINKRLTAIGEAFNYHATMMIAEDGTIYAAYGQYFWQLGDSVEEAIETLYLQKKELKRIPYNNEYSDNYEKYFGGSEGYVWQKDK